MGFVRFIVWQDFTAVLQCVTSLWKPLTIQLEESTWKIIIKEENYLLKFSEEWKEINNIVGEIQGRVKHDVHRKNWIRIAPTYYVYKICKVMEEDLGIENMMEDLEEQPEA